MRMLYRAILIITGKMGNLRAYIKEYFGRYGL